MCSTCQMPGVPAPRFAVGQRVEASPHHEQGIIYGFSYNEHPNAPGYWYFIHFDVPRTFTDDAPETDLKSLIMSLFENRSKYLYHRATHIAHPDGDWLIIPTQRGSYFTFSAFDPDGQELQDYPNVYQSVEGAIEVGRQYIAYTMARLKAGEWRV